MIQLMIPARQRRHPKRPQYVLILLLCLTATLATLDAARTKKTAFTSPDVRMKWYGDHVTMKEKSLFTDLKWQFLGPTNISGRMTDIAVVTPKGKHYTIYLAGASGGVWKTVNEGTTWEPVFQHAASTSIGAVSVAPTNQDIVWVGTGEANIFRSSMAGAGIYKSTDAGKTWTHMGLTGTHTIARITVHPKNPDIVYVAASGHEWTNNPERGVYKTTDGGKSWEKILFINDETGIIDLVMDPTNPETLYAAAWQRIRKKWNDPRNEPGYSHSGIYKSTDGGKNWSPINQGLPKPQHRGRIGLDICRSKPDILYAFVDDYEVIGQWEQREDDYGRPTGGKIRGASVYRSNDGGKTWKKTSPDNDYMQGLSATYGWVFGQIRVDPVNPDRIYVMGLALNISDDAGKTFRPVWDMHGDHHGLWIDPENPGYLVNVNDGGVAISYDGGDSWRTFYDNLPLVQFFNVMHDMDDPFRLYGSIQDHGSYRGVVDLSRGRYNIPAVKWEGAPGGEGSSHAIDPTDPNVVYSANFYGSIGRTDMRTGKRTDIVPKAKRGEPPLRGQWIAPFIISPHNPRIIYHGMNHLFRSMDRGDSWERISPDLTYNDKNKSGDIRYQTIFSISESPLKFGLIYVGTDDGRAHVTRDGGQRWTEITKGLPRGKWVSRVIASAFHEGTVYVSQNGKRDDDFTAYLWKSVDYGKTWQDLSGNIPCGPINVVREDPKNKNLLYVGTDLGVYVSLDGGRHWDVLCGGFPTTFVHDLVIHPRDGIMAAATHGRGMWAVDVRDLQQLTGDTLAKNLHLLGCDSTKLPRKRWWGGWTGGRDAFIRYYLKNAGDVKITITGKDGKAVKTINKKGRTGLNILRWDLKKETKGSEKAENPYVEAGTYILGVTSGKHCVKSEFKIMK